MDFAQLTVPDHKQKTDASFQATDQRSQGDFVVNKTPLKFLENQTKESRFESGIICEYQNSFNLSP